MRTTTAAIVGAIAGIALFSCIAMTDADPALAPTPDPTPTVESTQPAPTPDVEVLVYEVETIEPTPTPTQPTPTTPTHARPAEGERATGPVLTHDDGVLFCGANAFVATDVDPHGNAWAYCEPN